jgi:hypothetical protein
VNLDKEVNISDAILIARIAAEDTTLKVSDDGIANANIDGKDGVSADDVTLILKFLAGIIQKDALK